MTHNTSDLDARLRGALDEAFVAAAHEVGSDRGRFESVFKRHVNDRISVLPLGGDRGKFMAVAVAAESMIRDFNTGAAIA